MNSLIKHFKPLFLFISLAAVSALGITGCSGGGSSDTAAADSGEIVISLTDAKGDFASYTVDVLSLNLTRANGAEVTALPLSTRVDFAQYTDMTEFLTAATVPSGAYTAATMTLDFSNADIWVEDDAGESVQVSTILDENGAPLTTLEVTVQLEGKNKLVLAPGTPAHLMLDFDLQASNQINWDLPSDPALTVDPFLVADVNRTNIHKVHRLRGLLDEVDTDTSTFSVVLRPFYCALADNHRKFGLRDVTVTADTVYDIDGVSYTGADGLAALDGMTALTPVVAMGRLQFDPLRFEAEEVYAGSSVPGTGLDVISGWVTQRNGDTLWVRGASLIRSGSAMVFNDTVTLMVGDDTMVTRQTSSDPFFKDDISVGQHITAFGTLTRLDPTNLEMDATQGYVRMMMTSIRGTVLTVDDADPTAQVVMDLQSVGKFRADVFDFAGTGIDSANDADPANYEVFSGTMDISGLAADTPVKFMGFPEPFGMAPADFSADTLIDVTDLRSRIRIDWVPPTDTPFTQAGSDGLILNLDGTGRLHDLVRGSVVTDLNDLSSAPTLVAGLDGEGLFVLKYDGITEVHTVFADFVTSLDELLVEGYPVKKLNASGAFDDTAVTMTSDVIEVCFTIPASAS